MKIINIFLKKIQELYYCKVKKMIIRLSKIIFLNSFSKLEKKQKMILWKRKEEKYYNALFLQQTIGIKQGINLLKAELKKEINILPRIIIVISTRCSMKCEKCGEFIPYFEKKNDISTEYIIDEIYNLFRQIDYIYTVEVIGGEPFIHKDFAKIMNTLFQFDSQINKIQVTTNAVFNIQSDIIHEIKNSKLEILISEYPNNKAKVCQLGKILKEEGINFKIIRAKYWTDFGPICYNNLKNEQINHMYMQCNASRDCRTLYMGNLFYCSRGPYMIENGYNPNRISIYSPNFKRKLYAFYNKVSKNTCGYCNYNRKPIPVAKQIT